ncbi:hypothetical protein LEP1GSC051_0384 [Leptospira sp. P2653]|nr:hypothetical protein LEP1GSC051_0384 [Leptospira sp. P2653]
MRHGFTPIFEKNYKSEIVLNFDSNKIDFSILKGSFCFYLSL